jgi:putative phosphoesterase
MPMKIAVLSDSHDNIWKLAAAMPHLAAADAVIHCGDLCSPFMVVRIGEGVGGKPVHIVWGNNDGDPHLIGRNARAFPGITLHGELARFEFGGLRIAVNHYPELARGLATSGEFDLVCYGHDHTAHQEWMGACLLLNPGELMGMRGSSRLAVVDTKGREVEDIDLGPAG